MLDLQETSPRPSQDLALPRTVLTRTLLHGSGIHDLIADDAPALQLATDCERRTSLMEFLDTRPAGNLWVFGYGSLMWNPTFKFAERRVAQVEGWRRAFCISAVAGRGTPDRPGLFLGLDRGGECRGVAFRIAEDEVATELPLLWRREMLCGLYVPRWLVLQTGDGDILGHAIAFTINVRSEHHVAGLSMGEVVDRLAHASGALGSSADYLFRTRDALRASGIPDRELETLGQQVERAQGGERMGCPSEAP